MKLLRIGLVASAALLIVGGYTASTIASLTGDPRAYAKSIDQPSIAMLALLLLLGSLILAFIPDRETPEQ